MANINFEVNLVPKNTEEVTYALGNQDNKWNVYVNRINGYTPIFGIKGDKEVNYRMGQVNLTPENIGAVNAESLGENNGVATLDREGKLNSSQIPVATIEEIKSYLGLS